MAEGAKDARETIEDHFGSKCGVSEQANRRSRVSAYFPDDLVHLKNEPTKLGFVKRTFLDLSDEDDSDDDDDTNDEDEDEEEDADADDEKEGATDEGEEHKVIPRANPTRDHSLDENPAVTTYPFSPCYRWRS